MMIGFLATTVLLFLVQKETNAFSSGAGGCDGGMAAVSGLHLDTRRRTVLSASLYETGTVVQIESTVLDVSVVKDFPVGQDLQISVSSSTVPYKGVLVRLEAPTGVNTAAALLPGTNTAISLRCLSPIIGITHTNNTLKSISNGTIRFDAEVFNIVLGITVVLRNDASFSIYGYNEFKVNFRAAPIATPTVSPPVVPPTPVIVPIIPPTPVAPPVVPPAPVTPPIVPPTPVTPPVVPPVPVIAPIVPPTPVKAPVVPPAPVRPPVVPLTPVAPPVVDCTVTFDLFNALTNSKVATLRNSVIISNPPPCGQTNIQAVVPCGDSDGKVIMELYQGNNRIHKATESALPYFLFGNNGSNVKNGKIKAGSYRIRTQVNDAWTRWTHFTLGGTCS